MIQISSEEIKSYVIDIIKGILETPDDDAAFMEAVRYGLCCIIEKYTTKEYAFNLAIEYFVGRAPSNCYDVLKSIVEKEICEANCLYDDDNELNVAFAAYYALSLIYKKQGAHDKLHALVGDKYSMLDFHPLRFEVKSRYYKRIGEYEEALDNDDLAIQILENMGVVNQAVGISFASTVCIILEKSSSLLDGDICERAAKYIEDAIAINPSYPKYYFLKAKLLFYSMPRDASEEQIKSIVDEVNTCLRKAEVALFGSHHARGNFREREIKEYSEFKKRMKDTLERRKIPMFPKSHEELDELKSCILRSESQDACVSAYMLPPVPKLQTGDKYFFVCYSSRDFKSVYCDLIELYKHKVPFRYDERLTNGEDWKKQVEQYISDNDCVGVVFYLSQNILSTDSVSDEIKIVTNHNKKHFCVNLEGSLSPSKILIKILVEECASIPPEKYPFSGSTLRNYLNFFKDEEVFTHKFRSDQDEGVVHFKSFIDAIQKSFPAIIIGE